MSDEENDPYVQVKVRIRKSVRDYLAQSAETRNASLNSEIVSRLEKTVISDGSNAATALDDINEILARAFRSGLYSIKVENPELYQGQTEEDLLRNDVAYSRAVLRVFHNLLANDPATYPRDEKEDEIIGTILSKMVQWTTVRFDQKYPRVSSNE